MTKFAQVVLLLAVGTGIGCVVCTPRKSGAVPTKPARAVVFDSDDNLRITQSQKPGVTLQLVPFSVKRGDNLETFGEGPRDSNDLWLITYGDTVVSCRLVPKP